MPILVFGMSGVPAHRRAGLEAVIEAAGRHVRGAHEAWVVWARGHNRFSIRITGPDGFFRQEEFDCHQTDAEVGDEIRQALLTS